MSDQRRAITAWSASVVSPISLMRLTQVNANLHPNHTPVRITGVLSCFAVGFPGLSICDYHLLANIRLNIAS